MLQHRRTGSDKRTSGRFSEDNKRQLALTHCREGVAPGGSSHLMVILWITFLSPFSLCSGHFVQRVVCAGDNAVSQGTRQCFATGMAVKPGLIKATKTTPSQM